MRVSQGIEVYNFDIFYRFIFFLFFIFIMILLANWCFYINKIKKHFGWDDWGGINGESQTSQINEKINN